MDIGTALSKLNAKPKGQGKWRAPCPAHGGEDDNLEIRDDGGKAFFTCYSHNCDYKDILAALGEEARQPVRHHASIMPPEPEFPPFDFGEPSPVTKQNGQAKKPKPEITNIYEYKDESGEVLYEKLRYQPKDFRQRVPLGNGRHNWSLGKTRRVLYNLPAVVASGVVFIVEGEKDADALTAMGITATCNFDGAGKWLPEYNESLRDKVIYIIPDNDQQGDDHAKMILSNVRTVAKSAKIVDLPGLDGIKGGDFSDWIEIEGNDKIKLFDLCENASDKEDSQKWEIMSIADAQSELEPIEYAIEGVIAMATVNMIYGAPATLKSMIGGDMCMAIVSGNNWLPLPNGSGGFETNYNSVLWIDIDNGRRRSKERFGALSRAYNIKGDDNAPFYFVSMPSPPFIADKIDSIIDMEMAIQETKAGVVFIDNLGLITGDTEENGSGMAKVMGNLRAISERTGAAIVLIHHQRKAGIAKARAGDSVRGHSSIEAALDLALNVSREPNSSTISIQSTKTRGVDVPPVAASFAFEHAPNSSDLYKARFWGLESVKAGSPIEIAIYNILERNKSGMNQGDLIDAVIGIMDAPAGKNAVRGWIISMANNGKINTINGDKNAIIYIPKQL